MPSVIILGGGYAGLAAARRLGNQADVTLIDAAGSHELKTRLPAMLGGHVDPDQVVIPFSEILPEQVRFIRTTVTGLDPQARAVETQSGTLRADHVVIALGSVPDFLGVSGVPENTFQFKSLDDALQLRRRMLDAHEARPLRVVVVGAGYTGVEVAGQLVNWPDRAMDVIVVADTQRVLQDGNEHVGAVAQSLLEDAGVTFRLGVVVERVTDSHVALQDGKRLPVDITVWAARTVGVSTLLDAGLRLSVDRRAVVDPYLQAVGHPNVWVAGDAAAVYDYRLDRPVPSSAQMAVEEGRRIADNIHLIASGSGPEEFRPVSVGEALELGGANGVAEVGGLTITGRAAVAAKQAALVRYLTRIGGPRLALRYA